MNASLEQKMNLLKQEEARFRYLVTSTKTSPEYRKEALARLQELREKIFQLSSEIAATDESPS